MTQYWGALGYEASVIDKKGRCFYSNGQSRFGVGKPLDGGPATPANGGTIAFLAASKEAVDNWHTLGLANGGSACEEPPGVRDGSFGKRYCAYLRDPSGNKITALFYL